MMLTFLKAIFGWLTGGTLGRILDTVDKRFDNETERQLIRKQAVDSYLQAQVAVLTGPGWWFPLFFIIPLGLWFSAVCLYSVLFCAGCAFPQAWTVAALPPPLDQWGGVIVASMFVASQAHGIIGAIKK
jgi:hypothetical protein